MKNLVKLTIVAIVAVMVMTSCNNQPASKDTTFVVGVIQNPDGSQSTTTFESIDNAVRANYGANQRQDQALADLIEVTTNINQKVDANIASIEKLKKDIDINKKNSGWYHNRLKEIETKHITDSTAHSY